MAGETLPLFPLHAVLLPGAPLGLRVFERRYLDHVLAASGGHVGKAAAAAGIARRYFQVLRSRVR